MNKLREAAEGEPCVRCGVNNGTTVLCHYFGARRHSYGGGMGRKGHDVVGAWLCFDCHQTMDRESKDKSNRWLHSEEFLHLCALTWVRLWEQGKVR